MYSRSNHENKKTRTESILQNKNVNISERSQNAYTGNIIRKVIEKTTKLTKNTEKRASFQDNFKNYLISNYDENTQKLLEKAEKPQTNTSKYHEKREVPTFNICNIVATSKTNCDLDLRHLYLRLAHAQFSIISNDSQHQSFLPMLVCRIKTDNVKALIMASMRGNLVSLGTNSQKLAELSLAMFTRLLQKVGYKKATFNEFKITNIVGTGNMKSKLNLEKFVKENNSNLNLNLFCNFDVFPGVTIRPLFTNMRANVFISGKIIIVGGKSMKEINQFLDNLSNKLKFCKL